MSEQTAEYLTEALEMLNGQPAAIIEQPRPQLTLRDGIGEEWTVAWVKLSTAFKPHIKALKGSPLAVWLYISLSINKQGVAFPSMQKIADETGYSRQGVVDAIAILETLGYLKVRRGERRFNLYEPEFAAIGKMNEPSGCVNSVDSSGRCVKSVDTLSKVNAPNESTPLYTNKNNKSQLDSSEIAKIEEQTNRKVDAILDQERQAIGKINYPKRESLPEPIRELIDAWVSATGIKPLAREAMGWLSEGQNWLNLHATAKDVIAAFDYAKANYPAMPTTPFGLTNTLRAYKAGTLKSTTISADRRPSVETL